MFIGSYTYEREQRIALGHKSSEFVSRAKRSVLRENKFEVLENLSRHSVRVASRPERLIADIERARQHGPAHVFYTRENGREFVITDRIFVRFRAAKTDDQATGFGHRRGLELIRRYSEHDVLYRILSNGTDPVAVVVRLMERDRGVIVVADHDVERRLTLHDSTAGDPLITQQWHLSPTLVDAVHRDSSIYATDAWELLRARGLPEYGSPDVVIGIIDGGFRMVREFSASKFAGFAYIGDGRIVRGGAADLAVAKYYMASQGDHGDCCAGLAAAEMNAFGGAGVAPGCRLFPVKCDYDRPTRSIRISDEMYEALVREIEPYVDIICNAWDLGGHEQTWPEPIVNQLKTYATQGGRRKKGVVFLWAAGNWNRPINCTTTVPVPVEYLPTLASHDRRAEPECKTLFVNSLAEDLPGFAHVGAVTSLRRRSHYANYGPGLSFCAPSNNAHTYGWEAMKDASLLAPMGYSFLVDFGGTSAATAIAAGAAALVITANPSLTAAQVVSILKSTADKNLDMTAYDPSGVRWDVSPVDPYDRGLFDEVKPDGTWSPWFGHGKINVRAAVEKALP